MASNGYLALPVTTDTDTLIQQALANVSQALSGWIPREGNLEVLLLEQFAEMVTEAANVAGQVPMEIFKYYGSLLGVQPLSGAKATIATNWTINAAPTSSLTIAAGTQAGIYLNNVAYVFTLDNDLVFSNTDLSLTKSGVHMTAVSSGTAYNSVTANSYLNLTSSNSNIGAIIIEAAPGQTSIVTGTTNTLGTDDEGTSVYLNRLASALTLLTPRPITASDYAEIAPNIEGIYRAGAIDGYYPFWNYLSSADAKPSVIGGYTTVNSTASTAGGALQLAMGALTSGFAPTYFYPTSSSVATVPSIAAGATSNQFLGSVTNYSAGSAGYYQGYKADSTIATTTDTIGTVGGSTISTTGAGFSTGGGYLLIMATVSAGVYAPAICAYTAYNASSHDFTGVTVVSGNSAWAYANGAIVQQVAKISPEPVVFASVNGTTKAVTLVNGLQNYNSSISTAIVGGTVSLGQGITQQIGSSAAPISANHDYAALALVDKVTATTGNPVLTVVAHYADNSTRVFASSLNTPLDYTSAFTALTTNVSHTGTAAWPTTPVTGQPTNLHAPIQYVNIGLYWANGTSGNTHKVRFVSFSQLDGSPNNFLPDSSLSALNQTNGSTASWTLNAALTSVGGSGLLYAGSGVATSGDYVAFSPIFNLSAGVYSFDAYAYIGAIAAVGASTHAVEIDVVNGSGTSIAQSSVNITTSSSSGFITVPFVVPAAAGDCQVTITFKTGLNMTSQNAIVFTKMEVVAASKTLATTTPSLGSVAVNLTVANANAFSTNGGTFFITDTSTATTYKGAYTGKTGNVLNNCTLTSGTFTVTTTDVVYQPTMIGNLTAESIEKSGFWTAGGNIATAGSPTPRNVTVIPMNDTGAPISASLTLATQAYFQSLREVNFRVNIIEPNYVPIDITWSANAAAGYDPSAVLTAGNAILSAYINPAGWGGGLNTPPFWDLSQNTIRYLDIAGILDDVSGLASLTNVNFKLSTTSSYPANPANLVLPGYASVPLLFSVSGTVQTSNSPLYEVG